MSTHGRIVREAFTYIKRYQGVTFVVHLVAPTRFNRTFQELIHDIYRVHQIGISIVCVIGESRDSTKNYSRAFVDWLSDYLQDCGVAVIEKVVVAHGSSSTYRDNLKTPPNTIPLVLPQSQDTNGLLHPHCSYRIASLVAVKEHAKKLIYIENRNFFDSVNRSLTTRHQPYRDAHYLQPSHLESLLQEYPFSDKERLIVEQVCWALARGVVRAHILSAIKKDILLAEIFSHQGSGIMIFANRYEFIRPVKENEIADILRFTRPLSQAGVLRTRSKREMLARIKDYVVSEIDGTIQGCAALKQHTQQYYEIGTLAVHPAYRRFGIGKRLVRHCLRWAQRLGASYVIAITHQASLWFVQLGFESIACSALSAPLRDELLTRARRKGVVIMRYAIPHISGEPPHSRTE